MNDTEKRAHKWLQGQGYDNIVYQRRNSPDFMTGDGKGFEAKLARNNVIWFGPNQLEKLAQFQGELVILIFQNKKSEPVEQIPFNEIRHHARFWKNYRIEGWDSDIVPPVEILSEEEAENMLKLEDVAERLGITYPAARMLVLYEGAIPYKRVGPRGIRIEEADLKKYITKLKEGEAKKKEVDTREPFEGGVLEGGP